MAQSREKMRKCLACEGTGRVRDLAAEKRHAEKWGHPAIPAFMVPPRRAWTLSCPVCLGSGQVEAKPPARDALADAETLRGHYHPLTQRKLDAFYSHVNAWAAEDATEAAAVAFRAVPGLRGEVQG